MTADSGPSSLPLTRASSTVILSGSAEGRNLALDFRTTESGQGLVLQEVEVEAEDWPIVSYSLRLPSSLEAVFVWETKEPSDAVRHKILPNDEGAILLTDDPDWLGSVRKIGLLVRPGPGATDAKAAGSHIVETEIVLSKPSVATLANVLMTRWSAFRGWSGASINHLGRTLLPVLFILWAAASALLAGMLCRGSRLRAAGFAALGGLGAGWLILHALWLNQLQQQTTETRGRYGMAGFEVALFRGQDQELVMFARRVKEALEPYDPGRRIFLVSRQRFFGERARYLLLPYSAAHLRSPANLQTYLPELRAGDGVATDPKAAGEIVRVLRQQGVPFRKALEMPAGSLFVITGNPSTRVGP